MVSRSCYRSGCPPSDHAAAPRAPSVQRQGGSAPSSTGRARLVARRDRWPVAPRHWRRTTACSPLIGIHCLRSAIAASRRGSFVCQGAPRSCCSSCCFPLGNHHFPPPTTGSLASSPADPGVGPCCVTAGRRRKTACSRFAGRRKRPLFLPKWWIRHDRNEYRGAPRKPPLNRGRSRPLERAIAARFGKAFFLLFLRFR